MRRREFIALVGSGIAGWPLAARAQQPAMLVIGLLSAVLPGPTTPELMAALRQGLKEVGYLEGENVAIEYRGAENRLERLPALAVDLVRKPVAVILAIGGTAPAIAAKGATTTIPIIFTVPEDPVQLGLVASLSRPGGNRTGVNLFVGELVPKRLELLRELVPGMARVAVFVNPANSARAKSQAKEVESAGRAMGLGIQIFNVGANREIDTAFKTLARERPDALFVAPDPFFVERRVQLANLTARHAIPASFFQCGGRRPDELWDQYRGGLSSSRHLRRPCPQGSKARGIAGRANEEVRTRYQHVDRQDARPYRAGQAARCCRRGDRMSAPAASWCDPAGGSPAQVKE